MSIGQEKVGIGALALARSASILLGILLTPSDALKIVRNKAVWVPAIAALFVLFVLGSGLEREAVHHVEAMQSLKSLNAGGSARAEADSIKPTSLSADLVNWCFAFVFIVVGIALAAVFSWIVSMLNIGSVRFGSIWASIVNIAVPTIGIYAVVSGLISMLRGPEAYTTYVDLSNSVPNAFYLLPNLGSAFTRGFAQSINPFSVWAGYLYFKMYVEVCMLRQVVAVAAAISLVCGGAVLQGLLSAIST